MVLERFNVIAKSGDFRVREAVPIGEGEKETLSEWIDKYR